MSRQKIGAVAKRPGRRISGRNDCDARQSINSGKVLVRKRRVNPHPTSQKVAKSAKGRSSDINALHAGPEFAARSGMTSRGPKRTHELDPDRLTNTTIRLPVALLLQLDQEAARVARQTGIGTVNRSDLARALLAEALAARQLGSRPAPTTAPSGGDLEERPK